MVAENNCNPNNLSKGLDDKNKKIRGEIMEVGKRYRISYRDGDYTLLASGKILKEEEHLIEIFDDKTQTALVIGKSTINRARILHDERC